MIHTLQEWRVGHRASECVTHVTRHLEWLCALRDGDAFHALLRRKALVTAPGDPEEGLGVNEPLLVRHGLEQLQAVQFPGQKLPLQGGEPLPLIR